MTVKKKQRRVIIAFLVIAYVATELWLYAYGGLSLPDTILLDVFITFGFVVIGGIIYAATRGNDDLGSDIEQQ